MTAFPVIHSRCAVVAVDNIDTDRIIPARFLKVTDRASLGNALFADWKLNPDGTPNPEYPLEPGTISTDGARILVVGRNFGCGSSREHASWALLGAGIKAVIGTEFADIFRNNALKNGLLAVTIDDPAWRMITAKVQADPATQLSVDLQSRTVSLEGADPIPFGVEPFARECLLEGVDELGYLLARDAKIGEYERHSRIPLSTTRG